MRSPLSTWMALIASARAPPQVDDEHGFIRFFHSLPDAGDGKIRIFDRGDWYTAHGEDANFIARTVWVPEATQHGRSGRPWLT